jgi:hypothetical protein
MNQDGERRQRIKTWMGAAMIIVALVVDVSELGLEWLGIGVVANVVTTPVFAFIFWLWFLMLGIPFMASPKRFFTFFAECMFELIPGLDAVGGFFWTAGTILLIIFVRAEDSGGVIGDIAGATMTVVRKRFSSYKGAKAVLDQPVKTALVTTKEIASEAAKRRAGRNIEQYERATGLAANVVNKAIERNLGPQTRRQFLGTKRQRGAEADKNALSGNAEQSNTSPNTLNLKGSKPE